VLMRSMTIWARLSALSIASARFYTVRFVMVLLISTVRIELLDCDE